jgi:protein MpaA
VQKLGKNIGKYLGEGIDVQRLLRDVEKAATEHGWRTETFLNAETFRLLGLTRKVLNPAKRIYISTGIHGDEPAGPLAVLQLLQEDRWPENADIWLCPCLNPTGFPLNTRENAQGVDLNRDYLNTKTEEISAHIAWLEKQPRFDVCLCLHEDWESQGFYVYELNPDNQPSFAGPIVQNVAKVCPVDMSPEIEGRPASGGIIRPVGDPRSRPQWPEAFYLFTYKTRLSYTLEAPSDFEIKTRVAAEIAGVRSVMDMVKD